MAGHAVVGADARRAPRLRLLPSPSSLLLSHRRDRRGGGGGRRSPLGSGFGSGLRVGVFLGSLRLARTLLRLHLRRGVERVGLLLFVVVVVVVALEPAGARAAEAVPRRRVSAAPAFLLNHAHGAPAAGARVAPAVTSPRGGSLFITLSRRPGGHHLAELRRRGRDPRRRRRSLRQLRHRRRQPETSVQQHRGVRRHRLVRLARAVKVRKRTLVAERPPNQPPVLSLRPLLLRRRFRSLIGRVGPTVGRGHRRG